MSEKKLRPKQKRFVEEYLVDKNATKAAIRAGYKEKNARQVASENLTKLDVKEAVSNALVEQQKRTLITADRVVNEIGSIAFEQDEEKVKVAEKLTALGLLAKHFKLLTDKIEVDVSDDLAERMKLARERLVNVKK